MRALRSDQKDEAVAEIIGYILVFAMVVVTVSSFVIVYVPYSSNTNLANYQSQALSSLSSIETHITYANPSVGTQYTQNIPMGVKGSFFTPTSPTTASLFSSDPSFSLSYDISLNVQIEGYKSSVASPDNKVIATIHTGRSPISIVCDPVNGFLYVGDYSACEVNVISGATNKVVNTFSLGAGLHPYAMAFDTATNDLLITIFNGGSANKIVSVSTATGLIEQTLSAPDIFYDIAYDQNTGAALVSFQSLSGGAVGIAVYNATNFLTIQPPLNYATSSGTIPSALTYDPSNGLIYVAGGYHIWALNGVSYKLVTYYPTLSSRQTISSPYNIAFDSSNGIVYATASFVSGTGGSLASIQPSSSSDVLYEFNATNNLEITSTIATGRLPAAIIYDPSNRYIYVANYGSNSISIYNGLTANTPAIAQISVGNGPGAGFNAMTYDGVNGNVYVTNVNSNTVSVIEGNINVSKGWSITGSKLGLSESFNGSGSLQLSSANAFSTVNKVILSDGTVIQAASGQPPVAQTALPFIFNLTSGYLGANFNLINLESSGNVSYSSTQSVALRVVNSLSTSLQVTSGQNVNLVNGTQSIVAIVLNINLKSFNYVINTPNVNMWNEIFYRYYNNSSASSAYIDALTNWQFAQLPISVSISGDTIAFTSTATVPSIYSFVVNYLSYQASLSL